MAERGGQPGNQNATKEKRMITDALRRAAAQNPDKLKKACMAVLNKAVDGDLAAFNTLADRIDGKPTQPIANDPDNPIVPPVINFQSVCNQPKK